jgi:redox-sensitive bicupin YhaK (pirin superfamily)
MSGPVRTEDVPVDVDAGRAAGTGGTGGAVVEVRLSRMSQVGALRVRRALPQRTRRTVGAWCFADHMGPVAVDEQNPVDIGPHPHIGLQTVTWLVAGELLHHDSLGSEQLIRPGQLNLMTAGHGVVHAEESTGYRGDLHGMQLWVAQPERTRHGPAAFEHRAELPEVELGAATATVLVGEPAGTGERSPARHDTDGVGLDLVVRPGNATVPLEPGFEHALVVMDGAFTVAGGDGGTRVEPGQLAYLGLGRDEIGLTATEPARVLLLGGVPFEAPVSMWWNFVARDHAEIDAARQAWATQDEARFGPVATSLARVPAPPTPWSPR